MMSNHCSNKSIRLHHQQVNAALDRKRERAQARMRDFQAHTREAVIQHRFILGMEYMMFVYIMIGVPLYLGYII